MLTSGPYFFLTSTFFWKPFNNTSEFSLDALSRICLNTPRFKHEQRKGPREKWFTNKTYISWEIILIFINQDERPLIILKAKFKLFLLMKPVTS